VPPDFSAPRCGLTMTWSPAPLPPRGLDQQYFPTCPWTFCADGAVWGRGVFAARNPLFKRPERGFWVKSSDRGSGGKGCRRGWVSRASSRHTPSSRWREGEMVGKRAESSTSSPALPECSLPQQPPSQRARWWNNYRVNTRIIPYYSVLT